MDNIHVVKKTTLTDETFYSGLSVLYFNIFTKLDQIKKTVKPKNSSVMNHLRLLKYFSIL